MVKTMNPSRRWATASAAAVLALAPTASLSQQGYAARSQTFLMSQSDAHSKGVEAFAAIRAAASTKGALVTEGPTYDRVNDVTKRLLKVVPEMRSDADSWGWDFIVVQDTTPNAFVLPGGKLVVQTALIDDLDLTEDETAAVIGHEISHALREHSREKAGQKTIAKIAVGVLSIAAGIYAAKHNSPNPANVMNATNALGSMGAAAIFLLPNSRAMELEADRMGVDLAAMAGYDPTAAAHVWEKMAARGGASGGFLSTHPSHATRIAELTSYGSSASQRFADRRVAPTAVAVAPKPRPRITDSIACVLPGGSAETLAPLACVRVGGTMKQIEKDPESKQEETAQ
jgi:predicted Zn-dependent protease